MAKARTYTIKHSCKHIEDLTVYVKLSKVWLAEEAKRPCPGCREVTK